MYRTAGLTSGHQDVYISVIQLFIILQIVCMNSTYIHTSLGSHCTHCCIALPCELDILLRIKHEHNVVVTAALCTPHAGMVLH